MRNLKGVLVLATACLLALPACGDEEEEQKKEICGNQIDDDGDSKTDCADSDCAAEAACQTKQEICNNTIDDDGDSQFDCDDPDCDTNPACMDENCNNGNVDDDGDGKADCEDSDCAAAANCQGCSATETECGQDCCGTGETCVDNKSCVGTTVEGCLIPSTFGLVTVTGTVETDNVPTLVGNLPATQGTDTIRLELFEGSGVFTNGMVSGEITLTPADFDYATCGFCMRLWGDVDADGETHAADYFMTSAGSVTLTSFEGTLVASVSDAKFTHVTYDSSWAITPHADGCTTNIDTASFDGTFPVDTSCDPLAPTCAEGEGCYYDATAKNFLCKTAGTIDIGEACEDFGACVPGAECLGEGTCLKLCDLEDTSSCNAPEVCNQVATGLGACEVPAVICDPIAPTACAEGEACSFDSNEGDFVCKAAGTKTLGQACTAFGDCAADLECSGGFCKAYCTPGAETLACAGGAVCAKFTSDNAVGLCQEDCTTDGDEDQNGLSGCQELVCASQPVCVAATCESAVAVPSASFEIDTTTGTQGLSGTCGGKGKEVIYNLTAGAAGENGYLTIKVTTPFDAVVYARTACTDITKDGELGCADEVSGSASAPKTEELVIMNYEGGTPITLVVDAYGTGVGVAKVEYTFTIPVCGNGTVELTEECEPSTTAPETDNCTAACKFNPIEISTDLVSPQSGAIAKGEVDWYKFVVAEDSAVTAEITDGATSTCASGELDSKLGIYKADGTHVATMDDGGVKYCSKLFFANLPAGTYLLKVEGYDADTAFDYVLNLTIGAVQACSVTEDYGTLTFTNGKAEEYLLLGFIPVAMMTQFDLNAAPDRLSMTFAYNNQFADGLVTGSFSLTGDELDPENCTICMQITEKNGRTYIPTGGGVTLTSVTGTLAGTLTDVTFTEAVGGSVVPNPCPTKITSGSFSATIPPPPEK